MMAALKECLFYEKASDNSVQCRLCPRQCFIKEGKRGDCKVRENQQGTLYSLVYARPCSIAIDPVEKKPLYHFLPGSSVYSIGTAGCNLHCSFCQNWQTSQAYPEDIESYYMSPENIVDDAISKGCHAIAYTYNEPIIFYEYVLDCAGLARKKGLKNIVVCNGFINQEPLKGWCKYIDAANIDLKSFSDDFYKKITGAWLNPVLETIKTLKKEGVWLELTNLLIPGLNDNPEEIRKMCEWIRDNVGSETPIHFSAFHPSYKLDAPQTPQKTLLKAREAAERAGLKYIYLGNIPGLDNNTYCPACRELVIERSWFNVEKNNLQDSRCINKHHIDGIWN